MKKLLLISSLILIFLLGLINAREYNITVCEEQLKDTLDMYNNCSSDIQQGNNCGTLVELLKDNNKKLSDNLHKCQRNKWVYFILTALLILTIIWFIVDKRKKRG